LGQPTTRQRNAQIGSSAVAPVTSHHDPHTEEGGQWKIDDAERHRSNQPTPESDLHHWRRDPRVDKWDDEAFGGAISSGLGRLLGCDGGQSLPSGLGWSSG
jgi:hypothetical protein